LSLLTVDRLRSKALFCYSGSTGERESGRTEIRDKGAENE